MALLPGTFPAVPEYSPCLSRTHPPVYCPGIGNTSESGPGTDSPSETHDDTYFTCATNRVYQAGTEIQHVSAQGILAKSNKSNLFQTQQTDILSYHVSDELFTGQNKLERFQYRLISIKHPIMHNAMQLN